MSTGDLKQAAAQASLFRAEVMLNHSHAWMGAIRLAQPVSARLVVAVATVIAVALLLLISFGSMTKKSHIAGVILPSAGALSVSTPNAGVLTVSHVLEGQVVVAGQILFTLSSARQNSQGELTALIAQQLAARQHSLEAEQRARQNQYRDKLAALHQQQNNLAQEASQLTQEIQLAEQRQQLGQVSVAQFQALKKDGYVAEALVQQKQEDLLDISTRLSTLRRNQLQLQANQQSAAAELQTQQNSYAADMAQLQNNMASLQQEVAENQNRNAIQITAPQAGTVTAINNPTGQQISAGQVLATLIPGDQGNTLEAQLYAPSKSAGFVAKGQEVQLRYAAFPYQKFGLQQGTVTDVSSTPFAPGELPPQIASTILSNAQQAIQGFNNNEALYRIRVKLHKQSINAYGQEQPLKPGMTLEADVLQENRKLWKWELEPVLAVARRT